MDKSRMLIEHYFNMWLTKNRLSIDDIFTSTVHYVECYGAEYYGINELKQWMDHKFKHQTVTQWFIENIYHDDNIYTVEWTSACIDRDKPFKFDGVSLITFKNGKIAEIKEFESKHKHYRPYK